MKQVKTNSKEFLKIVYDFKNLQYLKTVKIIYKHRYK